LTRLVGYRLAGFQWTILSVFDWTLLTIMNWKRKWTYGFEYRTLHIMDSEGNDLDRKWTTAVSSPSGVIFWYVVIIICFLVKFFIVSILHGCIIIIDNITIALPILHYVFFLYSIPNFCVFSLIIFLLVFYLTSLAV
jgi:hypothetical protein